MTENQETHVLRPEVKDLDTALQQLKYCHWGWTIAKLLMFCFEKKKGAGNIISFFLKNRGKPSCSNVEIHGDFGNIRSSDAANKKEGEIKAPH